MWNDIAYAVRILRRNPGFAAISVLALALGIGVNTARYPQEQRPLFFSRLIDALRNTPGVEAVGAGGQLPMQGGISRTVISNVMGKDVERVGIAFASITPDYFRALGIPVLRGRRFDVHDTADAPPVVILNQAAARRYFGSEDPVGKVMTPEMWNGSGSTTRPRTVVGVIGDVKLQGLDAGAPRSIYWPIGQIPSDGTLYVTVLAAGDPLALIGAVRDRLHALDPDLPLYDVQPLSQYVRGSMAKARNTTALVGLLAGLALGLTAIGLYGVIAYSVARRTREIGIRIALGADGGRVLRGFLGRGLAPSAIGVAIGLPAASASTTLLRGLLFGVAGQKPAILAAGAALMIVVTLAATYWPARRATRVDPMAALRNE